MKIENTPFGGCGIRGISTKFTGTYISVPNYRNRMLEIVALGHGLARVSSLVVFRNWAS